MQMNIRKGLLAEIYSEIRRGLSPVFQPRLGSVKKAGTVTVYSQPTDDCPALKCRRHARPPSKSPPYARQSPGKGGDFGRPTPEPPESEHGEGPFVLLPERPFMRGPHTLEGDENGGEPGQSHLICPIRVPHLCLVEFPPIPI